MAGEERNRRVKKSRPPLDGETLQALALRYVGKYATTRAKLATYLGRKLKERGWAGERSPDVLEVAERLAGQGYIDDAGYALMKSRSLTGRGYGAGRVKQSLYAAGVEEHDRAPALDLAHREAVEAALRFAKRRRIGPFAVMQADVKVRGKALAAFVRAGHGFDLAKAILALEPGSEPDVTELAEKAKLTLP